MRLSVALILLSTAFCASAARADDSAEAQVREVIEAFRTAIIAGDGETLRGLFLPEPQAWVSVLSDEEYANARAKNPKAARLQPGSYARFAESVAANPGREEEVFSNIDVRTDGVIAAVVFDFVYLSDGKASNRGQEAWHLVKTDAGWKIASVVYSNHSPSQPARVDAATSRPR